MITDDFVRNRFIHNTLSRDINLIYETQENVIRTYLNTRSGNLLAHIQKRPFSSTESDTKQVFYMRILPYLRFLDINYRKGSDRISKHRRRNLALYNRTVWGILYRETFPEIRYGFNDEVRRSVRRDIEEALTFKNSENK